MFHLKDFRRRNVSSSPYLSPRVLEASSTTNNHDPINEHDIPAHGHVLIHIPNNDNAHNTSQADSEVEDVFAPGDIVGKGSLLKGDVVSLLPTDRDKLSDEDEDEQFQVIKELGKGSYAIVYLVHQVFFTPCRGVSVPGVAASRDRSDPESNEDCQILGHMDSDVKSHQPQKTYGRKFAIKCLSKANLDREELDIQLAEVTIHQSLPLHPNIVALHKTLQTSSYLLLVLEYVPGEDLFYFLEQARDHYPSPSPISPSFPPSDPAENLSQEISLQRQQTPPTPSLLSSLHPSHLLSRTRLRLVASMFAQMCDAVATCHAVGVFHRDIKPENFIVTDGRYFDEGTDAMNGGNNKGRVVVKLTDFGLSTREEECSDMDCGSAPYMSYECRNNIAPTYRPREADVWSLGIVLINMLYHTNPWTDTAHGACPSFTAFRQDPVVFFMKLFTGMTHGFAEVLARRVFCVDDEEPRVNGRVKERRMTASELGAWVRSSLVDLLASDEGVTSGSTVNGVRAVVNGGHRLSLQMRISHRPVSRAASPFGGRLGSIGGVGGVGGGIGSAVASPRILAMSLSRAPSLAPALEREEGEAEGRLRIQAVEELKEQEERLEQEEEMDQTAMPPSPSRTSTTKRRKRGVRKKGKGVADTPTMISQQQDQQQQDKTLKTLAEASQSLAREISHASKSPSVHRLQLQPQQPSLLTPVSNHNHQNGHDRRMSSTSSTCTGDSEDPGSVSGESSTTMLTVATTVPSPSMMSIATSTATPGIKATQSKPCSISFSLRSSSNSSRTTSNGSSLRTAITATTSGASSGSTNSKSGRRYEPVSMYALPSALLSKPMGEGTRTPSRLSTSSGTTLSVGSGAGTQSQQPQTVAKKSSKWTLMFGKNNNSGGGGTSATSTSSTPAIPAPTIVASNAVAAPIPASASTSDQVDASTRSFGKQSASRPIPIPKSGPGHVLAPSRSGSTLSGEPAQTQATMSSTAINVTNVMMGLDPAPVRPHQNGTSGSLVGGGPGGGNSPRGRGQHGKPATGDSMAVLGGTGGGSPPYKPKSSSRSPGPAASRTGGFVSSASSSSASLVSAASSWVDQGQGRNQLDGWDKWTSDRMGMAGRGLGHNRGVVVGSGGVGRGPGGAIPPPSATGFGAGGGRHGSVGAAGGPFASSASSVIGIGMGSGGSWRSGSAMGTSASGLSMNTNSSGSGSGGASLHGSVNTSPGGSTSAFSRYSNSSLRSVSTNATSVSSGSGTAKWRNGGRGGAAVVMASASVADRGLGTGATELGGKTNPYAGFNLPKNVKIIDGIPWALDELPRGQHPNPDFGSPPARKTRTRNKKGNNNNNGGSTTLTAIDTSGAGGSKDLNANNLGNKLDTIIERPLGVGPHDSPNGQQNDTNTGGDDAPSTRRDASTSTTDLVAASDEVAAGGGTGGRVKKVHKGQINTLAKMLSALRR